MLPKVTVIIVNWNGGLFLEKCLAALMRQTVKPHEIILIDNASSDNSIDIALKFPAVSVLALDLNTGFARGNNLAIMAASPESEWIALLNPDAFADHHWLEELLVGARHNPEFTVFGSKLVMAEHRLVLDGVGDSYHMSGMAWRDGHGISSSLVREIETEIFSPCAAAALYRVSALREIYGFDEDFFCYMEDVDLGFRLRLAGHRCLYLPKSIVYHIGSGTTGGKHSDFSVYHGHRNLVWTFVKDMPGILFWILLPLHLLLNLATVIWFVLRGRWRVISIAKRDALLGLPKMWRKRKKIQSVRVASISDIWHVLNKSVMLTKNKHRTIKRT